jgi:hypothetical protein
MRRSAIWRCSGVLFFMVIVGMLTACGGGGGSAQVAGGSGVPNSATLGWGASPSPNINGYRIYYGTAPGMYSQPFGQGVNAGNVTTYTLMGLNSATTYYFAVTAYDASNNESGFSNEVSKAIP